MWITFSNEATAEVAVTVFARYGYQTRRCGTVVVTDCPTLLAVPVMDRAIGLGRVKRVDISPRPSAGLSSAHGLGESASGAPSAFPRGIAH
jgi:hypothetical protein